MSAIISSVYCASYLSTFTPFVFEIAWYSVAWVMETLNVAFIAGSVHKNESKSGGKRVKKYFRTIEVGEGCSCRS